jgi:hypothetical protein
MIAAKISIGLFLLRVTIKPIHKWIIYIVMGLTALTGLVFFFVTLLQCTPISYFWNKKQTGFCVNIDIIIALTFLYSAISVICDFTFAILPVFLVWGLNMDLKTRALLVPILGMACMWVLGLSNVTRLDTNWIYSASVAVVVRMAYVMDFKNPDFLYATVDIAIWSDIEQGLAITAGSLATLRPLYRKVATRLGLSTGPSEDLSGPSKKTPKWTPDLSSPRRKNFSSFGSLFRSEKGTVRDGNDEYGMGDLQPMRLRDDLPHEKDKAGFNTWTVQTGKSSDEERGAGTITMQKQFYQHSERRV